VSNFAGLQPRRTASSSLLVVSKKCVEGFDYLSQTSMQVGVSERGGRKSLSRLGFDCIAKY